MKWLDHEELRVLLQDARHQVVANLLLYQGTLDSSAVRAAEVFRPAVTRKSMGIVVSHNHSTGDSTPSTEDITVIENLVQATNHERKPGCMLQTSFHGILKKIISVPSLFPHPTFSNYSTVELTVLKELSQELADLLNLTLPIPYTRQSHKTAGYQLAAEPDVTTHPRDSLELFLREIISQCCKQTLWGNVRAVLIWQIETAGWTPSAFLSCSHFHRLRYQSILGEQVGPHPPLYPILTHQAVPSVRGCVEVMVSPDLSNLHLSSMRRRGQNVTIRARTKPRPLTSVNQPRRLARPESNS